MAVDDIYYSNYDTRSKPITFVDSLLLFEYDRLD